MDIRDSKVRPGVAGGGFVSVSAAQVYNAADFVCALLHCRSEAERDHDARTRTDAGLRTELPLTLSRYWIS